jgi:hypothetical protein
MNGRDLVTDEDYLWNEDEYYNQRKVSKRLFFG